MIKMIKTISGKVNHGRWNLISGRFKIGSSDMHTSNLPIIFILRASKWARVIIDEDGFLLKLIDAK
jgi:hypothetical protein